MVSVERPGSQGQNLIRARKSSSPESRRKITTLLSPSATWESSPVFWSNPNTRVATASTLGRQPRAEQQGPSRCGGLRWHAPRGLTPSWLQLAGRVEPEETPHVTAAQLCPHSGAQEPRATWRAGQSDALAPDTKILLPRAQEARRGEPVGSGPRPQDRACICITVEGTGSL